MKPTSDNHDALSIWQQRCQAQGLALTASRKAILCALLEQTEARDAVPLLQAAQMHHSATSIGTVYRFLRELEQRGLIDAHVQAHSRTRWRLRNVSLSTAAQVANDIRHMVAQAQDFLRTLEQMGLAEASTSGASPSPATPDDSRMLAILDEIASHLGYRLLPHRGHPA